MLSTYKRTALLGILFAMGCGGAYTSMMSSWKNPNVSEFHFEKIAVIAMPGKVELRQKAEDQLARMLPRSTATYPTISLEQLKDPAAVKAQLQAAGFDGAVVVRLVEMAEEITYVPAAPFNEFASDTYDWDRMGAEMKQKAAVVETRVYSLADGLLWSGRSKTIEPKSLEKTLPDIVSAAADRMKADGLVATATPKKTPPR